MAKKLKSTLQAVTFVLRVSVVILYGPCEGHFKILFKKIKFGSLFHQRAKM